MKRKMFGIKEALIASSIIASGSAANAKIQQTLTPAEIYKMNQLGLTAQEFEFLKQYTLLVSKFPELKGQFGLARIHDHFDINADEVIHETSNTDDGFSIARKIKRSDLPKNASPAIIDDGNGDINSVNVRQWCCD